MKKLGFTLSELLITLGIIGVAAALAAPAISNIMPDKNKAMFMKNYKELATITEKMLNDPELYYTEYEIVENNETDADGNIIKVAGRKYPTCEGLACTGEPVDIEGRGFKYPVGRYKSKEKFRSLCYEYLSDGESNIANMKSLDGSMWTVGISCDFKNPCSVKLTVNGKTEGDCSYTDNGCKSPNVFNLEVDKYGNVQPNKKDYLARAYLLNPNNYNNKKKDLACAAALKADPNRTDCADIEED